MRNAASVEVSESAEDLDDYEPSAALIEPTRSLKLADKIFDFAQYGDRKK